MASGAPLRWSDPLTFVVRLLDGVTVVNSRTVNGTGGEIQEQYTEDELEDYFGGPVPDTLSGDIVQQGTYGPGYPRNFASV